MFKKIVIDTVIDRVKSHGRSMMQYNKVAEFAHRITAG